MQDNHTIRDLGNVIQQEQFRRCHRLQGAAAWQAASDVAGDGFRIGSQLIHFSISPCQDGKQAAAAEGTPLCSGPSSSGLPGLCQRSDIGLSTVPHLLPMSAGKHTPTSTVTVRQSAGEVTCSKDQNPGRLQLATPARLAAPRGPCISSLAAALSMLACLALLLAHRGAPARPACALLLSAANASAGPDSLFLSGVQDPPFLLCLSWHNAEDGSQQLLQAPLASIMAQQPAAFHSVPAQLSFAVAPGSTRGGQGVQLQVERLTYDAASGTAEAQVWSSPVGLLRFTGVPVPGVCLASAPSPPSAFFGHACAGGQLGGRGERNRRSLWGAVGRAPANAPA